MAGNELRVALEIEASLGFQDADRRQRHRHQCRLGVFGERQGLDRPFEYGGRQLGAERLVDLVEDLLRGREIRRQGLAHADRLATLPWEHERRRHALPCLKLR